MTLTTTVTWADLRDTLADELADIEDAYDELAEQASAEFGDGWESTPPTDDRLKAYQQQAAAYDSAAKSIQSRQQMLARLEEEYDGDEFEIKMLSGSETMELETELKLLAQSKGVDTDMIQERRNGMAVDAATVDAPEGVPRDDDESPTPSDAPSALTMSLWDCVERFNNAGAVDFRAPGLGSDAPAPDPTGVDAATPTTSNDS